MNTFVIAWCVCYLVFCLQSKVLEGDANFLFNFINVGASLCLCLQVPYDVRPEIGLAIMIPCIIVIQLLCHSLLKWTKRSYQRRLSHERNQTAHQ